MIYPQLWGAFFWVATRLKPLSRMDMREWKGVQSIDWLAPLNWSFGGVEGANKLGATVARPCQPFSAL